MSSNNSREPSPTVEELLTQINAYVGKRCSEWEMNGPNANADERALRTALERALEGGRAQTSDAEVADEMARIAHIGQGGGNGHALLRGQGVGGDSMTQPTPNLEAAVWILENYEQAPCIAALLGEENNGPCTCLSCGIRAALRALRGLRLDDDE